MYAFLKVLEYLNICHFIPPKLTEKSGLVPNLHYDEKSTQPIVF